MASLVIKVDTAAEQLGLSVEDFRKLLEVFYPKTWQTIKQISKKNFKTISEQLMEAALAQPENESVDVEAIETEIQTQQTLLQESSDDYSTDLDSDFTGDGSNDFDNSQDEEESAIATIPSEEIELKVRQVLDTNINLNSQVFDLARITQTLAVLAADESVEQFRNIYTARLNQGVDDFLTEFSHSAINSIEQLRGQKTEDFFKALQTNYSRSNVKENMQKLSGYVA